MNIPIHPNCRCKFIAPMSVKIKFKKKDIKLITKWVGNKAKFIKQRPKPPTIYDWRRVKITVTHGFDLLNITDILGFKF